MAEALLGHQQSLPGMEELLESGGLNKQEVLP